MKIKTMAEFAAEGSSPEVLFWVGCAGAIDQRAQKVTKAFAKILTAANVSFGVLGTEESCNGDPARRGGNEMLFQMQAQMVIELLNMYEVKNIVTFCPHCFNIFKNEYPALGGTYQVTHHSTYLQKLLNDGRVAIEGGAFKGKTITYHDSCYLGRANDIYEAPRAVIAALDAELLEIKQNKEKGLCCGAGGAQVFKEPEPGTKEVYAKRTEQILETGAETVAVACPFCMTMVGTGLNEKDSTMVLYDISELVAKAANLA